MIKPFLLLSFILILSLSADNNVSVKTKAVTKNPIEHNTTKSKKSTQKSEKEKRVEKQVKEQMKKEKKYAKEMVFYQGDDYDLKSHEVDPNALADVPLIEPDYDFEMDDVYRDDL